MLSACTKRQLVTKRTKGRQHATSAKQKYIAAGHIVSQAAAVLEEAFAQPLMMHKQSFAVSKHMVIG